MAHTSGGSAGAGEAGTESGDEEHGDLANRWMGRAPVPASLFLLAAPGRRAAREAQAPPSGL